MPVTLRLSTQNFRYCEGVVVHMCMVGGASKSRWFSESKDTPRQEQPAKRFSGFPEGRGMPSCRGTKYSSYWIKMHQGSTTSCSGSREISRVFLKCYVTAHT